MRKVLAGIIIVGMCGAVVWGIIGYMGAQLPVVLAERAMGPYCVVFGPKLNSARAERFAGDEALVLRLAAAGVRAERMQVQWVMKGGGFRDGVVIRAIDAGKARQCGRELKVVTIPAQHAWVATTLSLNVLHGGARSATTMWSNNLPLLASRGSLAAMKKAEELGMASCCLMIESTYNSTWVVLLNPPE